VTSAVKVIARGSAPLGGLHPRELFRAEDPPFRLTLAAERADVLAELGVQVLYEIPFDAAFSNLSAASFVDEVLHKGVGAAHLACGPDFAFGHRRGGVVREGGDDRAVGAGDVADG